MKRKSTDYVCFLKGLFADLGGLLVSFSWLLKFRRYSPPCEEGEWDVPLEKV